MKEVRVEAAGEFTRRSICGLLVRVHLDRRSRHFGVADEAALSLSAARPAATLEMRRMRPIFS